jgi:pimeloyl-ACP methyl ester carboxylesterase
MSTITHDAEVRRVLSGSAETQVMVRGEGDPVLFLHHQYGWQWNSFLEDLSQSFTVYAPELAATEEHLTKMDDALDLLSYVNDVIDALELSSVHVVGHSLGGALAAELAALNTGRVRRLALLSPLGIWSDNEPVADLIGEGVDTRKARLFVDPEGDLAKRWVEALVDPNRVYYKAMRAYTHFYWPLPDVGLRKRAHRIAAPTLIVHGAGDGLASAGYVRELAGLIPSATVTTAPNTGHLLEETPEDVARVVVAHLQAG